MKNPFNIFKSTKSTAEKMIEEWIKIFPNKCIICSYHNFGIREGLISSTEKIQKHDCIRKEK